MMPRLQRSSRRTQQEEEEEEEVYSQSGLLLPVCRLSCGAGNRHELTGFRIGNIV